MNDKLTIIELLNRFGMAIDLRDWESFRSLFTEQVEFDERPRVGVRRKGTRSS